jgi:4a-hydroxytetrahydrobiopterin dehydratase
MLFSLELIGVKKMSELLQKKCVPCEGGLPPMSLIEENKYQKDVPGWEINRDGIHRLVKEFKFKNFKKAIKFVNKVAEIAENEAHHPDIFIYYNKVKFEIHTHAINGLFLNDFIVAAKIDQLEK